MIRLRWPSPLPTDFATGMFAVGAVSAGPLTRTADAALGRIDAAAAAATSATPTAIPVTEARRERPRPSLRRLSLALLTECLPCSRNIRRSPPPRRASDHLAPRPGG